MKRLIFTLCLFISCIMAEAQTNPAIISWLQNTSETGTYYASGNSTVIPNNILVNCQKVEYSNNFVYVTTTGVPAYPTGPFQDGNPSNATNQSAIYKIPLSPTPNTGNPIASNPGNIGVFINGVSLFDYRDGVGWNSQTNALCGGPGNPPCPGGLMAATDWTRDAVPAEKPGFDCSKGHPAMGNYHHHQNPSAFKLDITVISDVCNLYDAEGLYALDPTQHSPLIGFAYDGFPIYGAYGFTNTDGSGGITLMKSSYAIGITTTRTHYPDGTNVDNGPDVDATYFAGYFREDYQYVAHPNDPDYLDEHNGRFCITPEYPDGTYAYFATVDENWNSTYPYVVGPTFYGNATNRKVVGVTEPTTIFAGSSSEQEAPLKDINISIYPNPAADLVAIQMGGLVKDDISVQLFDLSGKMVAESKIRKGSTIAYFDTQKLYDGIYQLRFSMSGESIVRQVVIKK